MAWDFWDEAQLGGGECHRVKVYSTLVLPCSKSAGFYSDVVECLLSTRENLVRSLSGKKEFFFTCYINIKIVQVAFIIKTTIHY